MAEYKNNPRKVLDSEVSLTDSIKSNEIAIKAVAKDIIPDLHEYDDEVLQISVLQGGISNQLFLLASPKDKYVIRVYGYGTELFIDRNFENEVFAALSKRLVGPTFWGLFRNGRIEGYIPSNNVEHDAMGSDALLPLIAEAVAQLHGTSITIAATPENTNGSATEACIWKKVTRFFDLAIEYVKEGKLSNISYDIHSLRNTILELQHSVSMSQSSSRGRLAALEIVLCHNDLLCGNILYLAPTVSKEACVKLIDYEYAGYNYRAFDLANHFCGAVSHTFLLCDIVVEYGHTETNLPKTFPSYSTRCRFYKCYLRHAIATSTHIVSEDIDDEAFLCDFDREVLIQCQMSCLMWCSWSLLQSVNSAIDFDFLDFAHKRYEGFKYIRDDVLQR